MQHILAYLCQALLCTFAGSVRHPRAAVLSDTIALALQPSAVQAVISMVRPLASSVPKSTEYGMIIVNIILCSFATVVECSRPLSDQAQL